jgi:hypothetical protein
VVVTKWLFDAEANSTTFMMRDSIFVEYATRYSLRALAGAGASFDEQIPLMASKLTCDVFSVKSFFPPLTGRAYGTITI